MSYKQTKNRVREAIEKIIEVTPELVPQKFNQHSSIACSGDPANSMYFVLEGKCSLLRQNKINKKLFNAEIAFKGTLIGEAPMISGEINHEFDIVATKSSTVVAIPYALFHAHATPELLSDLINLFAMKLKYLVDQQSVNATMMIHDRLLNYFRQIYIQENGVEGSGKFRVENLNRHDIAQRIGCTREMVGKAIKEMSKQGLVDIDRYTIIINENTAFHPSQKNSRVNSGSSASVVSEMERNIMKYLHKHPKKYQQVRMTINETATRFGLPLSEKHHITNAFRSLSINGFIERTNKKKGLIRCTKKSKQFQL